MSLLSPSWRLLFPAITPPLVMSWVGSPLVMPRAFKAQPGPVPARGKRMGGRTVEKNTAIMNKREKVQEKVLPYATGGKHTGKPPTLRVWPGDARHQFGKGDRGCLYSVCVCVCFFSKPLRCLEKRSACNFNGAER